MDNQCQTNHQNEDSFAAGRLDSGARNARGEASPTIITKSQALSCPNKMVSYLAQRNSPSPQEKEQNIRSWIARKESVCPYAPGLARFVYMPDLRKQSDEQNILYFASELNDFYAAKEGGKRVGRWMLLPHKEWTCHNEAHQESEYIFWLLNAAYYRLKRNKKMEKLSLKRRLTGFNRGYKNEILNPIVGTQPKLNMKAVPKKSLFYSALSPLYRNNKFYRYSPHSLIPLVYASEFDYLAKRHPKVTEQVTFEMAYGGLYESFGFDLDLDLSAFRQELPSWGAIIDRSAQIMRSKEQGAHATPESIKGCPTSNLSYFRLSDHRLINAMFRENQSALSILKRIVDVAAISPKDVINTAFAGSGLYTLPNYYSYPAKS